jgi:hypothetical protein
VIHDIAPEAQLSIDQVADSSTLKMRRIFASQWHSDRQPFWDVLIPFYDGSCYFDNAVCTANHANRNGILWVNSAGNHARKHYEALFTDRDGDRLHNVTPESNLIAIDAQAGDFMILTLTWDAWPVTNHDYDLLL